MDLDEGVLLFYEMEGVAKRFMKNVLTIFQNIIVQSRLAILSWPLVVKNCFLLISSLVIRKVVLP